MKLASRIVRHLVKTLPLWGRWEHDPRRPIDIATQFMTPAEKAAYIKRWGSRY